MIKEQIQELVDMMGWKEEPRDGGCVRLRGAVLLEAEQTVFSDQDPDSKKQEIISNIKAYLYGTIRSELKHVKCLVDGGCPMDASDKLAEMLKELK